MLINAPCSGTSLSVNVDENNPLVYDFYNFPDHFVSRDTAHISLRPARSPASLLIFRPQYKQRVESSNPANISALVLDHLRSNGVPAHPIKRGIDHGVWCPLKVAFQKPFLEELTLEQRKTQPASTDTPSVLPSTLSLTQVSLPVSESSIDSLKLGASLRALREQGFAIVGGGMSVHNLRDMMRMFAMGGGRGLAKLQPTQYSESFLSTLDEAMTVPPASRDEDKWSKALKLDHRDDFLPSHPTPEHFLRRCFSYCPILQ